MAKNVIIIAGNIGAGKSTLVNYIKQKGNFLCIQEFIDKSWRDHFYSDRKNYASYFEKSCLMGRIARHLTAKKSKEVIFFDRGLIEGREIFVQNDHDEGFLSFKQLNSYDHDLKEAIDALGRTKEEAGQWMESLIVYLKAPPKVCFKRQFNRNKTQDETGKEIIPLEYFKRLDDYYEKFIENLDFIYKKWGLPLRPRLLVIDASKDIYQDPQYLESVYQKIKTALSLKEVLVQKRLNVAKSYNQPNIKVNPPQNPQRTQVKVPVQMQQQQRPQIQNKPQQFQKPQNPQQIPRGTPVQNLPPRQLNQQNQPKPQNKNLNGIPNIQQNNSNKNSLSQNFQQIKPQQTKQNQSPLSNQQVSNPQKANNFYRPHVNNQPINPQNLHLAPKNQNQNGPKQNINQKQLQNRNNVSTQHPSNVNQSQKQPMNQNNQQNQINKNKNLQKR